MPVTGRAIIVGAGIAGVSAAGALRAAGFDGEVFLLGDEPELPYRRPPVSKEIIRGEKTADGIRIKKEEWYRDNDIELLTGIRVASVDTRGRLLEIDGDTPIAFGTLLLATGGRARTMGEAQGIRTLRTLADVPRLRAQLMPGQHVIVVGAGLIGSEIAASARGLGCEVTLLEAAGLPLPRLLPPSIGQMYVDLHKGQGTDLHTDVTVADIVDQGGESVVTATDGRSWAAPIVVLAIGMVPATDLAEAAGIAVDNGIVVDAAGRTSMPGIFAAGDVANQPNTILGGHHRVEHWQGAQNHGTSVGHAMAGEDVTFGEVPWCWSDQYGQTLQVTGWPEATDDLVVRGVIDELDFSAFFLRDGRLVGAVTIGRPGDVRAARKLIGARAMIGMDALADESTAVAECVSP